MNYIKMNVPPYPFFIYAGNALYRSGDFHRKRSAFTLFDILLVEYGCLYMVEDGCRYKLRANDMLILSPGNTHSAYKPCDTETYFHWLHFDTTEQFVIDDKITGELVSIRDFSHKNIKQETLTLPVCQTLSEDKALSIINIMNTLESYSINKYNQSNMVAKENIVGGNHIRQQALFCSLLSDIAVSDNGTRGNLIAKCVLQYLNMNYYHEVSLEDMALAASCHPTHVIRCFNAEYNTTPGKMLTQIRLQHAKELLTNSSYSCAVIAEKTGFSTSAYFSKVFSQNLGISPSEYRKKKQ